MFQHRWEFSPLWFFSKGNWFAFGTIQASFTTSYAQKSSYSFLLSVEPTFFISSLFCSGCLTWNWLQFLCCLFQWMRRLYCPYPKYSVDLSAPSLMAEQSSCSFLMNFLTKNLLFCSSFCHYFKTTPIVNFLFETHSHRLGLLYSVFGWAVRPCRDILR